MMRHSTKLGPRRIFPAVLFLCLAFPSHAHGAFSTGLIDGGGWLRQWGLEQQSVGRGVTGGAADALGSGLEWLGKALGGGPAAGASQEVAAPDESEQSSAGDPLGWGPPALETPQEKEEAAKEEPKEWEGDSGTDLVQTEDIPAQAEAPRKEAAASSAGEGRFRAELGSRAERDIEIGAGGGGFAVPKGRVVDKAPEDARWTDAKKAVKPLIDGAKKPSGLLAQIVDVGKASRNADGTQVRYTGVDLGEKSKLITRSGSVKKHLGAVSNASTGIDGAARLADGDASGVIDLGAAAGKIIGEEAGRQKAAGALKKAGRLGSVGYALDLVTTVGGSARNFAESAGKGNDADTAKALVTGEQGVVGAASKVLPKLSPLGKMLGKTVPGLSSIIGGIEAVDKISKGDNLGAAVSLSKAALWGVGIFFPPVLIAAAGVEIAQFLVESGILPRPQMKWPWP